MAISFYGIFYFFACQLREAEFARIAPNIFCTSKQIPRNENYWHFWTVFGTWSRYFTKINKFKIINKSFECPRLMSERYQKAVYCAAQFATAFLLIEELLRAKRASGAPRVRKWSNLPIRENLVITWPYTDHPPERPSIRTTGILM